MGSTIIEKILARASGQARAAADDIILSSDSVGPGRPAVLSPRATGTGGLVLGPINDRFRRIAGSLTVIHVPDELVALMREGGILPRRESLGSIRLLPAASDYASVRSIASQ